MGRTLLTDSDRQTISRTGSASLQVDRPGTVTVQELALAQPLLPTHTRARYTARSLPRFKYAPQLPGVPARTSLCIPVPGAPTCLACTFVKWWGVNLLDGTVCSFRHRWSPTPFKVGKDLCSLSLRAAPLMASTSRHPSLSSSETTGTTRLCPAPSMLLLLSTFIPAVLGPVSGQPHIDSRAVNASWPALHPFGRNSDLQMWVVLGNPMG